MICVFYVWVICLCVLQSRLDKSKGCKNTFNQRQSDFRRLLILKLHEKLWKRKKKILLERFILFTLIF